MHGRREDAVEVRQKLGATPHDLRLFAVCTPDLRSQFRAELLRKEIFRCRQRENHRDLVEPLRQRHAGNGNGMPQFDVIRAPLLRQLGAALYQRSGDHCIVGENSAVREERHGNQKASEQHARLLDQRHETLDAPLCISCPHEHGSKAECFRTDADSRRSVPRGAVLMRSDVLVPPAWSYGRSLDLHGVIHLQRACTQGARLSA